GSNYWVDVVFVNTGDTTPPVISNIAASSTTGTTATITWTTDEGSTTRVDYGTSPSSLTLTANNPSFVTAHSIALTGLTAGTTYYYRVTSVDSAGNSATSPAAPASPLSFVAADTTPPVVSAVTVTPGTTTATITWTTDENSTTRVDYGTSQSSLNLNVSN